MSLLVAPLVLLFLGAPGESCPPADQGAVAEDRIRARVLLFYQDDRAHRWPDILGHFWVGKVSARWPAPTGNSAWVRASRLGSCARSAQGASYRMAMTVIGNWARVFFAPCDVEASVDELWLLGIGGDWRIARLERGQARVSTR